MSCKYCDVSNYESKSWTDEKSLEFGDAMWVSLSMVYAPKPNQFFIEAMGDDSTRVPIEYCPKCGRRLTAHMTEFYADLLMEQQEQMG